MTTAHTGGFWQPDLDDMKVTTDDGVVDIATAMTPDDFPCLDESDRDRVAAECRANVLMLAAGPRLVANARAVLRLFEDVRDDQSSPRFGRNAAERADHARILASYIEANADDLDAAFDSLQDAVDLAVGALTRIPD